MVFSNSKITFCLSKLTFVYLVIESKPDWMKNALRIESICKGTIFLAILMIVVSVSALMESGYFNSPISS